MAQRVRGADTGHIGPEGQTPVTWGQRGRPPTLKDQNWSPGLTAGRRMAMTTSPGAALLVALTKLSTLCQAGLALGLAVCTSAPAAMSSVAASDSRPMSLVSTKLPPSVAAALTCVGNVHLQHTTVSTSL